MTYTRANLKAKVEWEGGVLAALDYGIKPEDIEGDELRDAWEAVRAAYIALNPLIRIVEEALEAPFR